MKTPPYGKPLKALLEVNPPSNHCIWLFIGQNSWHKSKAFSISYPDRVIILPPHDNPMDYEWPVKGCDILLIETSLSDMEFVDYFVNILFSYEAKSVHFILMDFSSIVYKKDF